MIYSLNNLHTVMSKRETILRYNLIINTLRQKGSTFKEINNKLAYHGELEDYNLAISERTFIRDRDDIRSLYGIDIQYDQSQKVYYIKYDDNSEIQHHLLEAFDTVNAFKLSSNLSSGIYFQKRKPKGTENLYGLVHAIKNKLVVTFDYQKFYEDKPSHRTVHAIALKEYRSRWYLMAINDKDDIVKSFGLDRISQLSISPNKSNKRPQVDIEEKYKHCFGIICGDNEEPEQIVLSFTPFQGQYIKSMPLHYSQKILIDNDNEYRIELKLHATHDLKMEILSMGDQVKVIQPKWFADEIKETLECSLENYKV